MQVAIIGAGPAGLSAAYELSRQGAGVTVYEAGPQPGGMAQSLSLWGQRVDVGPHRFFSADPRVNRLWLAIAGQDYRMVRRLTRIYYRGRFFHYPLQPANALANLGPMEAVRCLASFAAAQAQPLPAEPTFEDWVSHRFGRRLYRTFFKTYSEKLWGIPCRELDADFAMQRIKGLSLGGAVRNALLPRRGGEPRTLVDEFAYPTGGTGMIYERMAAAVRANGGAIHYRTPVQRLWTEGQTVRGLCLQDGTYVPYDHVVSSMPLSLLVQRLPDVPAPVLEAAGGLRFRSTVLVYLHVNARDLFPDNWLYIHAPELATGRITNFRNWAPELYGDAPTTILALEYWCQQGEADWQRSDRDFIALAAQELAQTGLARAEQVLDGHVVRLPRCYPIYERGYRERLKPIIAHLRQYPNLQIIGRYGAFKYNNQDHSLLMGLLAAENILHGAGHDTWGVNTEAEYQEASRITAAGLVYDGAG
jgi:protoporphyrinogen oxidase